MRDDYERATSRSTTSALPPQLREALASAARGVRIEDLDARASHLVLTHARRTKAAGFFARVLGTADPDTEHWCALAVTPEAVFVGTHGARRGTWVRTLPLDTLELESMPLAGELAERTVVLSSPVFGQGPTHPRGTFAVIFASTDDARAAQSALEDARAAHWRG